MSLEIQTEPLTEHLDARGRLIKAWPHPCSGEIYVVELLPGSSRGHHYHHSGGEWFVPLEGQCTLVVQDPQTGERAVIPLEGIRARVEPGLAHALFAQEHSSAWVMAVADRSHGQDKTTPYRVPEP